MKKVSYIVTRTSVTVLHDNTPVARFKAKDPFEDWKSAMREEIRRRGKTTSGEVITTQELNYQGYGNKQNH